MCIQNSVSGYNTNIDYCTYFHVYYPFKLTKRKIHMLAGHILYCKYRHK